MPYRVQGNNVLHKKGGKWKVKQTYSSPQNAQAAIRLLRAIEHNPNFKPRGK